MIHTKKRIYKPISDLNKNAPAGFKFIQYRMLPDIIKFQVISNKISQMEKSEFNDICTLLNYTLNDINDEKQQLEEYLNSLRATIKKDPANIRRKTNKITQKEIDNLALRPNLITQSLEKEYNRVFPLLIELIKKKHNVGELECILKESKKLIFNLQIIMETDIKALNDHRKELSLENNEGTNPMLIQERQFTIQKLKGYIISYVNNVYTPIIEKHRTLANYSNSKLEHFYFNIIDPINKRIEKIKTKSPLDFKEFYFDDELHLHVIVRNKPQSKYPLKVLHFSDLEITQKKVIIQILKAEVRS